MHLTHRAENHDRERSLGWLAVAWMEHYLRYAGGDLAGVPMVEGVESPTGAIVPIHDLHAALIVDAYALNESGKRLYRRVLTCWPKGAAKSHLAYMIATFEALGPARFAGFARGGEQFKHGTFEYTYTAGEPMGKPVTSPVIRLIANSQDQIKETTYSSIKASMDPADEDPAMSARLIHDYGLSAHMVSASGVRLPGGGLVVPASTSAASADGKRESFAVVDECHLFKDREAKNTYKTLVRNMQKRAAAEAWTLLTTTAHQPGEGSIGELLWKEAQAAMAGDSASQSMLFDYRAADPDVGMGSREEIVKGVTQAYGPFADVMNVEVIADSAFEFTTAPEEFERYFFNRPVSPSTAYVNFADVQAVSTPRILEPGESVVLGFDGSDRRTGRGRIGDSTVLVAISMEDCHATVLGEWHDHGRGEYWEVPRDQVVEAISDAFDTYDVRGFYADPSGWQRELTDLEIKHGEFVPLKASREHPFWAPNQGGDFRRATEALEQAIVGERITLEPGVIPAHLLNAHRRATRFGYVVSKVGRDSRDKIDAAISTILAFQAYLGALGKHTGATGKQPKPFAVSYVQRDW